MTAEPCQCPMCKGLKKVAVKCPVCLGEGTILRNHPDDPPPKPPDPPKPRGPGDASGVSEYVNVSLKDV